MRRIAVVLSTLAVGLWAAGAAQAAVIDFNGVPVGTTDPTVSGVSFWAGDPGNFAETVVSNFTEGGADPTDHFLLSGFDDTDPGTHDTFIGLDAGGALMTGLSFDFWLQGGIPGNYDVTVELRNGGAPAGIVTYMGLDYTIYEQNVFDVDLASFGFGDFDAAWIYTVQSKVNTNDPDPFFGSAFRIDNVSVTLRDQPPPVIPEPSTVVLLGSGLIAGLLGRRRKAAA